MLSVCSRKRRIKMAKRCLLILLVLALCLAGIPAAAFADESSPAEEASPEFPFTDVKPGDWHYEYIRSAFLHGIVTGMTATTFVPEGKLTHAQVMVMAANLHSMQKKDNYDFQAGKKAGDPWYQVFKDYCKAEGIIDGRFDGKENEEVTRAEMSYYFAHTMTPDSYQERKAVSLSDIGSDPYKAEIEKLALADIVGGFTDGTFRPDDPVTRAQSAVYVRNTVDTIEELEEAVPEETPAGGSAHKEENVSAPVIMTQPQNATVDEGSSAAFTVVASGTRLTYQWEVSADGTAWADATDEGSTTNTLTVTATANNDGYQYRCIVTNPAGSVTSNAAKLSMITAPVITKQPQDLTTPAGTTATFTVEFRDEGSQFHWFFWEYSDDGTNWTESSDEGHDTDTLKVSAVDSLDGRQYRCRIENDYGDTYSDGAVLKVGVPLDKKYFPDEAFLAIASAFDGDGSGYLNGTELASAITIDGSYKGITTFEGLQYFTALRIFNCSGNSLTELDLTALTGLMTLICSECGLTELDLSANVDLQTVQCDRNSLTQLTLGEKTQLKSLDCNSNAGLTSVDLSGCTALQVFVGLQCGLTSLSTNGLVALEELYCQNNALTSLDVGGCTALRVLACEKNLFDGLDLSSCPTVADTVATGESSTSDNTITYTKGASSVSADENVTITVEPGIPIDEDHFPDGNFRSFLSQYDKDHNGYLSDPEIEAVTEMTINETGVASLEGIKYFEYLTTLTATYNYGLTTVDLRYNQAITTLDCHGNDLQSLDVSDCHGLTQLFCHDNPLASLDVSACTALADAIVNGSRSDCESYWEYAKDSALLRVGKDVDVTPADPRPFLEIHEDRFPDENFRSVVSGFDSDSDGWLSRADLAAAAVMDCSNKNINNVEGIEFFTALTELDCSNNQLMELDVSSSKGLTTLNCSNNMLSSLDLNQNPALTTLDCNWNALESLNVSSCSALTTLYCYANRMEALDLSGCTALTELVCRSAHLVSLTISGKTALTTLDCRNNEITTLSVTDCPALTSVLFTGNDLKSLDLSGCPALTGVNFSDSVNGGDLETADLSGCIALTEVNCTDRNIVSLDLSGCASLKTVYCFNNKLTSLDVSGCTALTSLDCSINSISALDVSDSPALCDAITLGEKSGTDIVTYVYNGATLKVNSTVSLTPPDPNL